MPNPDFQIRRRLVLRRSRVHGRGVFAREFIPAGTRLIEYQGERITNAQADARYPDDPATPHHTFFFAIDGEDVVVDAAVRGNMARYINHSCDPNCDAMVEGGKIYIDSMHDIQAGEELTYDYNFILDVRHSPAMKRRYPCVCGAANCRGTILAKKR